MCSVKLIYYIQSSDSQAFMLRSLYTLKNNKVIYASLSHWELKLGNLKMFINSFLKTVIKTTIYWQTT